MSISENIPEQESKFVTITRTEYCSLLISAARLERLDVGGVDNWSWHGESLNPENEPSMDDIETEIHDRVFCVNSTSG